MAAAAGPTTRLAYFDDMWAVHSQAAVLSLHQEEGGRRAVVLDATIFHPQGGGQPADTGVISAAGAGAGARFLVEDVRMKDGVVRRTETFAIRKEGDSELVNRSLAAC